MDNIFILATLLDTFGPIKGERSLQKLVYIAQTMAEIDEWNFDWNIYGPVSYEIERDLEEAEALGLLQVIWEDDGIPVYHFSYEDADLSSYWRRRYQEFVISDSLMYHLSLLKNVLGNNVNDPELMEALASLDFLEHNDLNFKPDNLLDLSDGRFSNEQIIEAQQLLQNLRVNNVMGS